MTICPSNPGPPPHRESFCVLNSIFECFVRFLAIIVCCQWFGGFWGVPGPPRHAKIGLKRGRVVQNKGFKKVGLLGAWLRFDEALRPFRTVLLGSFSFPGLFWVQKFRPKHTTRILFVGMGFPRAKSH